VPEAEVLLDSMLDALPAPKQPSEGRARAKSRRVSTAALSPAGSPPVITRPEGEGGSAAE
jgi:ribonuclease E